MGRHTTPLSTPLPGKWFPKNSERLTANTKDISSNDLIGHGLKFILHLLQECLHLGNNKTRHPALTLRHLPGMRTGPPVSGRGKDPGFQPQFGLLATPWPSARNFPHRVELQFSHRSNETSRLGPAAIQNSLGLLVVFDGLEASGCEGGAEGRGAWKAEGVGLAAGGDQEVIQGGAVQGQVNGNMRVFGPGRGSGPETQGSQRPPRATPLETRPPETVFREAAEKAPGSAGLAAASPGCHGLGPAQSSLTTEVRSCMVLGSVSAISPVPSLAVMSQTVTNTSVCRRRRPQRLLATTGARRETAEHCGSCSWRHAPETPAVSRFRSESRPRPSPPRPALLRPTQHFPAPFQPGTPPGWKKGNEHRIAENW